MSARCPICNGARLVIVDSDGAPLGLPRPCTRCCPSAPGRLLKSREGETLEGAALHDALTKDT